MTLRKAGATLALTLLCTMAILCTSTGTAVAQTVLRFNQNLPSSHWAYEKIIIPWIKDVERATEGRVQIQLSGASLGGFTQSIDLVGEGIADVSFGNYGLLNDRFPLAKITELPFLGSNHQLPVSLAYWNIYKQYFDDAQEHEQSGVKAMAMWVSGANHFFMRERPVTQLADLKGMRFSVPSALVGRMLGRAGAVGVVTGTGDVYEQFSRSMVDGVTQANTGPNATRIVPFIKHQTSVPGGLFWSGFFIVMNDRKWQALPEQDKHAMWSVSGEHLVRKAALVFEEMEAAEIKARQEGGITTMHEASPAFLDEMREAFTFVEEEWIAEADKLGLDGKAALATLRESIDQYENDR